MSKPRRPPPFFDGDRFDPTPQSSTDETFSSINVTPLVDVMLVLLVVFIITTPLFTQALNLDLPDAGGAPVSTKAAEPITLAIERDGQLIWSEQGPSEPIDAAALLPRLQAIAQADKTRLVQLRADKDTRYEQVARLMATVQDAGLSHLVFITDPRTEPAAAPP